VIVHVDMTLFQRGLQGLIRDAKLSAPVVIEKETGELIKTLVKQSPPKNPAKRRAAIKSVVGGRFATLNDALLSQRHADTSAAPSGMRWYHWNTQWLFGIAPEQDMTDADVDDLRRLFFRTTKGGRLKLGFRHPRRRQRVLIQKTILTKRSTVNKLIARFTRNVGRLRAGWLVAVAAGKIKLSGAGIPQWVARHMHGARGGFESGLGNEESPSFTIFNNAVGIGRNEVRSIAQFAVNLRAKAMLTNARMFMRGKKKLSDYAR